MAHAHETDIQTQIGQYADGEPAGLTRYRWRCSAGCKPGPWQVGTSESGSHASAARRARNGATRHVAAMERG